MDYRESWEHKEYLSRRRLDRRVQLFHAGLLLLVLAFLLDFWLLQMVRGGEYAQLAETNRLRRIQLDPSRGVIVDRNGRVLASSRPSLSLVLRRDELRDADDQLQRLAPILGISYETLLQRHERMRSRPLFEPLVLREDVRLKELAWIEARREWFPSVEVLQTARRSYPEGDALAHALGYVGEVSEMELAAWSDQDELRRGDIVGKTGIERNYDELLRGRRGWKLVSVNTLGRPLGPSSIGREPRDGQPLQLTLDVRLQRALREALGDEAGAGVFLDPWTGEVLALASSPSYDPNRFADGITHEEWSQIRRNPRHPLHDRVLDSFYAPGSTFKVVLAVAGLETGMVAPSATVHCSGSTLIYGSRRLCWKRGGHGTVHLEKALAESCNVYFYELGRTLGVDRIHEYGALFSLGKRTGIDLPGERAGILPSREWKQQTYREPWYPGDTISVSIGQGLLAVTPIQMAVMISSVATRGKLPRPHIVQGRGADPLKLPVSAATFDRIRHALESAVEIGTAQSAALGDIAVAGKTGTAQIYRHSAGVNPDELPKSERDHAWFVGYAPADEPRIAFAVIVEHGGHGGTSAAPVARRVLEEFFSPAPSSDEGPAALRAAAGNLVRVPDVRAQASR